MSFAAGSRLIGLVNASGAGGVRESDELWSFGVTLAAWRDVEGRLHEGELRVSLSVSYAELQRLMDAFGPYAVVAATVASQPHEAHVRLAALAPYTGADAGLAMVAERLRAPIVLHAAPFGEFVYDRGLSWYAARVHWCDQPIELRLSCFLDGAEPLLATARALFDAAAAWHERVTGYAADALLELKNDSWSEEDGSLVSREQFVARLRLESVTIDDADEFTFWFEDGDLFFGHVVHVSGTVADGPNDAGIAG